MKFESFSSQYRPQIEEDLKRFLTFGISDPRYELESAIQYSVLAPGKRIRPLVCMAVFLLYETDIKKILPLACAFEMVHVYSLIHDDLPAMDNDDFRRGLPT